MNHLLLRQLTAGGIVQAAVAHLAHVRACLAIQAATMMATTMAWHLAEAAQIKELQTLLLVGAVVAIIATVGAQVASALPTTAITLTCNLAKAAQLSRAAEYAAAVQEADDDDYQLVDDDGRTDGYGYDPLNIMMFCLVSSIFCMFFRAWQLNKKSGQAQVFANTTATHCEGSVTLNGDVSGHLWALFAVTLKMDVYQPKVRTKRYLKKKKSFNLSI